MGMPGASLQLPWQCCITKVLSKQLCQNRDIVAAATATADNITYCVNDGVVFVRIRGWYGKEGMFELGDSSCGVN